MPLLKVEACGCERALALYCWVLSGRLLKGQKRRHVAHLLREAVGAAKMAHSAEVLGRG